MKSVNLNGTGYVQKADVARVESGREKGTPLSRTTTTNNAAPDQVRLSDRGEQVRRMVAQANELSGIRSSKVARLRELIQSGDYKVSSTDIADAIIRDEVR
jgi:flagellar biosynthesis anti-sigma factor FlgM